MIANTSCINCLPMCAVQRFNNLCIGFIRVVHSDSRATNPIVLCLDRSASQETRTMLLPALPHRFPLRRDKACSTCARLLSEIPRYGDNEKKLPMEDRTLGCCGRVICGVCIQVRSCDHPTYLRTVLVVMQTSRRLCCGPGR